MSREGGGKIGNGNIGISGIPAGSRKVVQSLKEIVNNCTESEIYAALKECNMDLNETVNRLLSQDPFHEAKSKREKKKEGKDITDSRSYGGYNFSSRGTRGGVDRYGGSAGLNQVTSNESVGYQGKPAFKIENGTYAHGGSLSTCILTANNTSHEPASYSGSVATENMIPALDTGEGIMSSSQPLSGFQPAWIGIPGQLSMADIVKMGRPHGKASLSHHNVSPPPLGVSNQNLHPSQNHSSMVSEAQIEGGFSSRDIHVNDEWPLIEDPPSSNWPPPVEAHVNSILSIDRTNQRLKSQLDDIEVTEDGHVAPGNYISHATVSGRNMQDDDSLGSNSFEQNEAKDGSVSPMAASLHQLNLQEDDQEASPEEDKPSVVIPSHLQLHTAECLQLSFGSFGSSNSAVLSGSGSFGCKPIKSDLEGTSATVDVSAIGLSDNRNAEYYEDEHLRTTLDGNIVHRTGPSAGDCISSSVCQGEILKQETCEPAQRTQYLFSSTPGYTYESSQNFDVAYTHPQTTSQMLNLASFSSVMQAYTNSLPSMLLTSSVPASREDLPYSPFFTTLSMPTKYNNLASFMDSPTIPMSEALRAGSISTPQPTQQTMPGTNVASGPSLPQHLAVHPYSQPTLPLGHYTNMISYPYLPQGFTYMPSAFQHAFGGNSTYPESLAALLPQYKNSISSSSLPQSAAVASGYGFGNSTSISGGNFPLNPPTAPTGTTIGYDDAVSSHYKDSNHLNSIQQNDNPALWVHGPGSRPMSAVPPNTYYGFHGQNQLHAGFRQGQQPSQQFGDAFGYPNF